MRTAFFHRPFFRNLRLLPAVAVLSAAALGYGFKPAPDPALSGVMFTNNANCDITVIAFWSNACPCDKMEATCVAANRGATVQLPPALNPAYTVLCAVRICCDSQCVAHPPPNCASSGAGSWFCQGGGLNTGTCGNCSFTLSGDPTNGFQIN